MDTVNIHHAKTHLSQLLSRVELGEEIIIANRGVPVAKLVPILLQRGYANASKLDKRSSMGIDCAWAHASRTRTIPSTC